MTMAKNAQTGLDKLSQIFDKYCNVVSQNTKGVQIGIYSIAITSLTIALRRVRPFSRFKRPRDVPNLFIKEKRQLFGYVQRIDPNGGILMVEHTPLIPLMSSSGTLPVKVAGVQVTGHGLSWLQAIVAGNKIEFIPISKERDFVQCEVILPQIHLNKLRHVNIGEALVSVGFGTIDSVKTNDVYFRNYIEKLKTARDVATRKKLGIKYYVEPTKLIISRIAQKFSHLMSKLVEKRNSSDKTKREIAVA